MDMKTPALSAELVSEPSQGTFSAETGWSSEAPVRPSLEEVHATVRVPAIGHWLPRLFAFAGPGYMVSVGYMDPGNWATDIAGGSQFGYTLLSVILLSNLMAILLQGACRAARYRHWP